MSFSDLAFINPAPPFPSPRQDGHGDGYVQRILRDLFDASLLSLAFYELHNNKVHALLVAAFAQPPPLPRPPHRPMPLTIGLFIELQKQATHLVGNAPRSICRTLKAGRAPC